MFFFFVIVRIMLIVEVDIEWVFLNCYKSKILIEMNILFFFICLSVLLKFFGGFLGWVFG